MRDPGGGHRIEVTFGHFLRFVTDQRSMEHWLPHPPSPPVELSGARVELNRPFRQSRNFGK